MDYKCGKHFKIKEKEYVSYIGGKCLTLFYHRIDHENIFFKENKFVNDVGKINILISPCLLIVLIASSHSKALKQDGEESGTLIYPLMAHNWQKLKSRFLTCPCHKIYRVNAVGL